LYNLLIHDQQEVVQMQHHHHRPLHSILIGLSPHQKHFLAAAVAVAAAPPAVAAVWLFPQEFALPLPPKEENRKGEETSRMQKCSGFHYCSKCPRSELYHIYVQFTCVLFHPFANFFISRSLLPAGIIRVESRLNWYEKI
jgi:hypothetical protein